MGRLLHAALLVATTAGIAHGKPSRKVKVETQPTGATVYIDDVGNGAACEATPCTIDVPLGSPTLIIQLAKHTPEFMQLDVAKGKGPLNVSVKLKGAFGVIRVNAPKGASVKVNDESKGKVGGAPLEIEVPAEPASVVITFNGKTQTELVEVDPGGNVEVEFSGGGGGTTVADVGNDDDDTDITDDDPDGGENPNEGPSDTGEADETPTPARKEPALEAGLAFDVAFRRFQYSDGSGPFNNSGEVLVGPAVEVWPGRFLGVKPLRGLSLFARVQFAVTHQKVTREAMGTVTDVGASTFWGGLEVSLRQKFVLGGAFGVEISGGFVRDQAQFNADNQTVLDMVPSADYRSLRFGAKLSYVGTVEPYVSGETRLVQSGGTLGTRAASSDASGYRVAGGLRTKLGPIGARAEFSYGTYTWAFSGGTVPPGATDTIMYLSLMGGYDF